MPPRNVDIDDLVAGVRSGRHRDIARAISLVESEDERREELLSRLHAAGADAIVGADAASGAADPSQQEARVIGVTGPPGAGKSTLISTMIVEYRRRDERVAVLAVDPTSPYSGGALLGDRIRMTLHGTDTGVFIRSIASRGQSGGLAPAGLETVAILNAAGFGTIIVESVGVGQTDLGVLTLADIVLLVLNPGTGDEIQSLKAGIMEIADIFVINKADYPGVDALERSLEDNLVYEARSALPAGMVRTIARDGTGTEELCDTIDTRITALGENGELSRRRRRRAARALEDLATNTVRGWIATARIAPPPEEFSAFRRKLLDILESIEKDGGRS